MRGKACLKEKLEDGSIKYKQVPPIVVHKHIGIADAAVELKVSRMRFYQSAVKYPIDHEQFLSAQQAREPMVDWLLLQ